MVVPLIMMFAPGIVVLSSEAVTVPETSLDWANKSELSTKKEKTKAMSRVSLSISHNNSSVLFMHLGFSESRASQQ
jgi:hypothetical protein